MINELANAANKDKQQDRDNLKVIAERLIEINTYLEISWCVASIHSRDA